MANGPKIPGGTKEELEGVVAANEKLASSVGEVSRAFKEQLNIILQMQGAISKITSDVTSVSPQANSAFNSDKIAEMAKELNTTERSMRNMTAATQRGSKAMKGDLVKSVTMSQAVLEGLKQTMKNVAAGITGVVGVVGSLVGGLYKVGKAIIGIPINMFKALVDTATSGGGGNELFAAYEAVRKQFGAFKSTSSDAIITAAKGMSGLTMDGRDAYMIFGNLAHRMQELLKVATAMGPQFAINADEFKKNGMAIMAFQKGLGLTDEMMGPIAVQAGKMGTSITEQLIDMTKQSYALAKAFGLDAKVISRDMGKMAMDAAHFGHLSKTELGAAAAYANKLGISVEKLAGLMDKFSTFDSTAESVSVLNEQFGTNIDAMKLMSAQNPGDKLEILRKAMRDAGKDISKLSFAERKLLADQAGMEIGALDSAMAQNKAGVSMEKTRTEAEKAATATMDQTAAIKQLTAAMERMDQGGGGGAKSFIGRFIEGFTNGIKMAPEFQRIMMNINRSLMEVYIGGMRLGRMFVDVFPGIKKMFQGWGDLFDPSRFRKLMDDLTALFGRYFGKSGNIITNFREFMDGKGGLKEIFLNFFSPKESAGKKILEGWKEMMTFLLKLTAEGLKYVIPVIADTMHKITQFILHPEIPAVSVGDTTAWTQPLMEIFKLLQDKLWPALKELAGTLASKLWSAITSPPVVDKLKEFAPWLGTLLFGPMLTRGLLAAATGGLARGVGQGLVAALPKILAGPAIKKAVTETPALLNNLKNIPEALPPQPGPPTGPGDATKLFKTILAIGAGLALAGPALAAGVWVMSQILQKVDSKEILKSIALIGAIAIAAVPLMFSLKIAASSGNMKDVAAGGAILGGTILVVGVVAAALVGLFESIKANPELISATGKLMQSMAIAFLAMTPVIIAAAALGALATGPQGLALAGAPVGFAIIAAAVAAMAGTSLAIVDSLNKMQIGKDFQVKIDAFLGIMKAIQAFVDAYVKILEMMAPSWQSVIVKVAQGPLGVFFGDKEDSFSQKLDAAGKFMKTLVGDAGGGIIGLMTTVEGIVQRIDRGTTAEMPAKAQAFASLLTATVEVMKAIMPSDAFFAASTDFMSRLHEGPTLLENLGRQSRAMSDFIANKFTDVMLNPQTGIITKMIPALMNIVSANPELAKKDSRAIEKAGQVAQIITSIAGIMKALEVDPKVVEQMRGGGGMKLNMIFYSLESDRDKGVSADQIKDLMKAKADNLTSIIDSITKGPLAAILNTITSIDPTKLANLDKAKVIPDIINGVVGLINAVSSTGGKKITPIELGDKKTIAYAVEEAPDIAGIISKMGDALKPQGGKPGLIDTLIDVAKLVPADASFAKRIESISKLFGIFSDISKFITSMKPSNPAGGGQPANIPNDLNQFLDPITEALRGARIASAVDAIAQIDKTITGRGLNFGDVAKRFNSFTSAFNSIGNDITTLKGFSVDAITAKVDGDLTKIRDLVTKLNELHAQIQGGGDIKKAMTVLPTLGTSVAATGGYTVQNKDVNIQINMHLDVKMDAAKLEHGLIARRESIIRDRINYIMENGTPHVSDSAEIRASGVNSGNLAKYQG